MRVRNGGSFEDPALSGSCPSSPVSFAFQENRASHARTIEKILAIPEEDIDLAEAALLLAQEAWEDLFGGTIAIDSYLKRLDEMASAFKKRIGNTRNPEKVITTTNEHLFKA